MKHRRHDVDTGVMPPDRTVYIHHHHRGLVPPVMMDIICRVLSMEEEHPDVAGRQADTTEKDVVREKKET